MKRCSVKPYEGNEKYIFVSYCHKDKSVVYPIIEKMARDGYRVWYDEGINPGTEWPEVIADHLNRCDLCLAFITDNALNSHNCRREINFSLLKKKPFISVVTEEVNMSPGMQMQLSTVQSILRYQMTDDVFYEKLYASGLLKSSLGEPDDSVVVSSNEEYTDDTRSYMSRSSFSDRWFTGEHNDTNYESKKLYDNESVEKPIESDTKKRDVIGTQKAVTTADSNSETEKPVGSIEKKDKSKSKKWIIPLALCFVAVICAVIIVSVFGGKITEKTESEKAGKVNASAHSETVATEKEVAPTETVQPERINMTIEHVGYEGFITDADVKEVYSGYEYNNEDTIAEISGFGVYGNLSYSKDFSDADKSSMTCDGTLTSIDGIEFDDSEVTYFSGINSHMFLVDLPDDLPSGNYVLEITQNVEYDSASLLIYFSVSYIGEYSITTEQEAMDFDARGHLGSTVHFENAEVFYDTEFDTYMVMFGSFMYDAISENIDISEYEGKTISGTATVVEVVDKYENGSVTFSIDSID